MIKIDFYHIFFVFYHIGSSVGIFTLRLAAHWRNGTTPMVGSCTIIATSSMALHSTTLCSIIWSPISHLKTGSLALASNIVLQS